ncbi:type II toxin-antitoxin system HicB family antitoxin [Rivularia sp. UHCC 0363]|uniref:type II toxin-antitoxin system HicB family antitoxin n=1 Tax=Rivularia sp. UHCC 0363 TaxID=3110244 RepID=UPI002B1FBA16|nr:type II toxin-antitoxin system HicB family antitoxin [Rivularia sp. UHCC 0363]MEA5595085.1 type II toxin-antitoxin system HicB family antitoxin [Rivularia sp. UHCC 0363]
MTTNLIKNTAQTHKLNYSILIEAKEGGYQATVWGLPDCQVFATTKEEAINNLHELMENRLKNVEIVTQEIESPTTEHPWMKFAGKYKDDPQFDDMLADIEAYRRELDAEMEEYYRQLDAEEEVK